MIEENDLKINCKTPSKDKGDLYPLSYFNPEISQLFIKYRTCVFEQGNENFVIPPTPGVIKLENIKLLNNGFFTRMTFKPCNPGLICSGKHFKRWVRTRNIFLIDAMLFIKQNSKTFCLFREAGPVYLPLQNSSYYELMRQLVRRENKVDFLD